MYARFLVHGAYMLRTHFIILLVLLTSNAVPACTCSAQLEAHEPRQAHQAVCANACTGAARILVPCVGKPCGHAGQN